MMDIFIHKGAEDEKAEEENSEVSEEGQPLPEHADEVKEEQKEGATAAPVAEKFENTWDNNATVAPTS